MTSDSLRLLRQWLPVPTGIGGTDPLRWFLLEGRRSAVAGLLLAIVFCSFMLLGMVWTFELQVLLTETPAVQTILTTMLSGIILLVSIVVSINSIVLSYDITSVDTQETRIEGTLQFQRDLGALTDSNEDLVNPTSFFTSMATVISTRLDRLEDARRPPEADLDVDSFIDSVHEGTSQLSTVEDAGGQFGVLWAGLETEYGPFVNSAQDFHRRYGDTLPEDFDAALEDLVQAFELFATGKEYFKTLYYTREVSQFSRTLLAVALPAILINASAILAINAELLPDIWVFGLPPLQTFVAAVFTISLLPYIVLTAYIFRLATVARRSAMVGPFSLQ